MAATHSAAAREPTSWRAAATVDRAFYDDHSGPVDVSLDDVANDGNAAASENDNVRSDVEDVWAAPENDHLVGNNGPNKLFGDAGNDRLTGLGGDDELHGGDG